MKKNLIFIGMPASGKSTIGIVAAKRLGYRFIDTDLMIQEQEGKHSGERDGWFPGGRRPGQCFCAG